MTQPFSDALAWVPKSRGLSTSLGRAHDHARAQGHGSVSLEHVLAALIEDPDASALLLSCNVDLLGLNTAIGDYLLQQPAAGADMPEAAPALLTILEYAVAAARQSKRAEINGAIVLAAIVGEGRSEAARLLSAGGLKFEDAVTSLRRTNALRPAPVPESRPPVLPPSPPPAVPAQMFVAHPAPETVGVAAPEADAAASAKGHALFDDDPVTTARRRIAAIRNGQPPPAYEPPPPRAPPMPAAAPEIAPAPMLDGANALAIESRPSDWTPPPLPQPIAPANRPVRLPPPVPPITEPPVRPVVPANDSARAARAPVPWAEPGTGGSIAEAAQVSQPLPFGSPIDPAELIERIPLRMQADAPVTVEIRISRAAVLATALAPGANRDPAITRALAVRLRAPSGGFHVENASPETQWFDAKSPQRAEDEIRWRWLVTPQGPAKLPLQLSIGLRTVAADGIVVETALPDQLVKVHVTRNLRGDLRSWMGFVIAMSAGVAFTLLATGGLSGLLGR